MASYRAVLLVLLGAVLLALPAGASADESPAFTGGVLNFSVDNPTSLAFGPDGRLYVASLNEIHALTLDVTGQSVFADETVATGLNRVLGIAFDPTAPASPVTLYASRQDKSATDGYEGVVSTFTGPTWTMDDVITGLPSSAPHTNHFTNGLAFDGTGRLFMAQGSNTDSGLADPYYPETPLSAAILYADVNDSGFDGTITYDPATTPADNDVDQTGGDVFVFAPGTRNPYDLVLHSNGLIYATDNGPNGPSTSTSCTTEGGSVEQSDELNLIEAGDYYGFPNRNRGRFDARQCVYHAPSEGDGADFTAPVHTFPAHCSCDGIAEYTSGVFGGAMQGDLLVAQFSFGDVARIELAPDGRSVTSVSTLASGYDGPLDVTVGPNGVIYVAEFSAGQVSFLAPEGKVGGIAELPSGAGPPGARNVPWAPVALAGAALLGVAATIARRRPT